jgi:LysR family transcriptional regulator for metE and metH
MDLDVKHLRLVLAVAEEGSLTRAGERLYLTQSALSHQLLDIEERLGTPLFLRVSKKMVLTPAGERVLVSARRILDDLERTEEDVRELAANRTGVIRLATECYTCYHWLPGVLQQFQEKYPRVDVRIDLGATHHTADALLEGRIDLGLIDQAPQDERVDGRFLFTDEMLVIVSPDHRLAARSFVSAEELAEETLYTYHGLDESTAYQRVLRPLGLEPAKEVTVPLTEAMIELIRAGLGVSVMARWAVIPQLASGVVKGIPLTANGLHRDWRAALLKARRITPYLEDFISLLTDEGTKLAATAEAPAVRRRSDRPRSRFRPRIAPARP